MRDLLSLKEKFSSGDGTTTVTNKQDNKNTYVFRKPTVEEVDSYIRENGYPVDANKFVDFYESKGWMVGKNKMKDWKACVRTWARKDAQGKKGEWSFLDL